MIFLINQIRHKRKENPGKIFLLLPCSVGDNLITIQKDLFDFFSQNFYENGVIDLHLVHSYNIRNNSVFFIMFHKTI